MAFKQAVVNALDAPNIVIGTITFGGDAFILEVKKREDIEINEVTDDNRDLLPDLILRQIERFVPARYRTARSGG